MAKKETYLTCPDGNIYEGEFVSIAGPSGSGKSTILNINHIYSITRNITSSSLVEFKNTHKKVYVSRSYYKVLKLKLSEKRR